MRELSLNVLDIAQNSISADASLIEIEIIENTALKEMLIGIYDNGKGMTPEQVQNVQDPFFHDPNHKKGRYGHSLFKLAAEQTGGYLKIESEVGKGTRVTAFFKTDSIDFTPLGDIDSTIIMLITMNTDCNFIYRLKVDDKEFTLSTSELKSILGDVPLNEPSVTEWIKEYLHEQTQITRGGVL